MKKYTFWFALLIASAGCADTHGRGDDAGDSRDAGIADAGDSTDAGDSRDAGGPTCVPPVPERHRPTATVCTMDRPFTPIEDPAGMWPCSTHEECTDGINGRCTGGSFHGYQCSYDGCFSDAECGAGPCACRGVDGTGRSGGANHCLEGNCQTDADCGAGVACSPTLGSCGDYSGTIGYYCHTCDDECTDDADCGEYPNYCAYDELRSRWTCQDSHCAG